MPDGFDRDTLETAFADLGARAWALGRTIEIAVYGGSALVLSFDWRQATRDVDAVFEADREIVRRLVAEIAAERDWPQNWLNDGVKGYLSPADRIARHFHGAFPSDDEPGLRVFTAAPAYLFAMKCRAMRAAGPDGTGDIDDIRRLGRELDITTAAEALDLVALYYPGGVIEPKTQFGLEEIFAPDNGA